MEGASYANNLVSDLKLEDTGFRNFARLSPSDFETQFLVIR